jgi:fibronectin type 3 domain-containing protein
MVRSNSGGGNYTITANTNSTFPTLILGTAKSGNLQGTYDVKYYQVSVTAGEHLFVVLDGTDNYNTYQLYIRFDSLPNTVEYDEIGDLPNADQAVEIASTQAGTYYVMVRSNSGGGNYTIVRKFSSPTNLQASDGTYTDRVHLTWNALSGSTSYNVYRAVSSGDAKTLLGSPVSTTYADTTATPGVTYYYWVKACKAANCSGFSTANTGWRNLPTPVNLQASDGTYPFKVLLTWNALSGSTSYNVYRATSWTGTKSLVGSPTTATFADTTAIPGVTYTYWVKACKTVNCSNFSLSNTGWRNLSAPANLRASDGTYTDRVQLNWYTSLGATSYKVLRATSSTGTKVLLGSPTVNSYADSAVTPGVTYYYWVRACKDTRCSDFSLENSGWRNLSAPANLQASDGTYTDKVQLTWAACAGATSYSVYRANSWSGTKTLQGSPAVTSFDDTTAIAGVTYYYWVKACRDARCSIFSAFNTGWRKP